MGAISGWGGRVQVNTTSGAAASTGTAMPVTRWTVNDRADGIDATTMEHAGFPDFVSGVNEYDLSFECLYDTTLNPLRAAVNLNPGVSSGGTATAPTYLTVTLSLDRSNAGRNWFFDRVLVTDVSMDDEVRGIVRYTIQAKATRGLTFVAGSTPTQNKGLDPTTQGPGAQVPTASPG